MNSLLLRSSLPDADGVTVSVTPQSAGWSYVGFQCVRLEIGHTFSRQTLGREACLVVLSGTADIEAGGHGFPGLGTRQSVFEGIPPDAVYVPDRSAFQVRATSPLELAVCSAPGRGTYPARRISRDRMSTLTRGEGANMRHVCNILPETEPADALLVVEVITPAGNWSSYPPHKHDTDNPPAETLLEETYYHRLNPPQGFAFQRVYTDDLSLDETMAIQDRDVVMVPRGYHPVGVPYGYELYYLNVMAGPVRAWHFHNDPAHAWIVAQR